MPAPPKTVILRTRVGQPLYDALLCTAMAQGTTVADLVRETLSREHDRRARIAMSLGLARDVPDAVLFGELQRAMIELSPIDQRAAREITDVGHAVRFAAAVATKPRNAKPPATSGSKPPQAWRSEVREHMASGPLRITGATLELRAATKADPLPSEFKLFSKGVNESTNGAVLFDARAAELTLAQWARHGVDGMIDVEHRSLYGVDETSRDAVGWFRPELRGGELWAANVSWTADGAARLRERRQRYTSPAFYCAEFDDEQQLPRVTSLINAAICSMPATYRIQPLVASARR